MLLKDCPVGSVVRLVSYKGNENYFLAWWKGWFVVEQGIDGKFITDKNGAIRDEYEHLDEYQFEIVHPAPEPEDCRSHDGPEETRITFTVGGHEFYAGQRVWSLVAAQDFYTALNEGDELEIRAHIPCDDTIVCSKSGDARGIFFDLTQFSTTPPAPHEWKRGDWARHEEFGVGFVIGVMSSDDMQCLVMVSFEQEVLTFPPSCINFISHSETPE